MVSEPYEPVVEQALTKRPEKYIYSFDKDGMSITENPFYGMGEPLMCVIDKKERTITVVR